MAGHKLCAAARSSRSVGCSTCRVSPLVGRVFVQPVDSTRMCRCVS